MTIVHNLRHHNTERVMRIMVTGESLSRSELANNLGFSKVTATSIVNALIEDGWLIETAKTENNTGRPAALVELHPKAGTVVGMDIQAHALGVLSSDLTSALESNPETHKLKKSNQCTQAVIDTLERLQLEQPYGPVRQVVMAVPAPVKLGGELSEPNRLSELDTGRIQKWADRAGVSIRFENDVNLATLAEFELGAGKNCENFALLSGRDGGVALGLFLDGQLYRGSGGQAGELALIGWSNQGSLESIEALPFASRELALAQVCSVVAVTLDLELFLVHQHPDGVAALNVADRIREFVLRPVKVTSSHYGEEGTLRGALLQSRHLAREHLLGSF